MIPKIIHYSWFSGDDYPEEVNECMNTWKQVLPGYEFVLWDAKKLAELNNVFANEAVSVKKWAFASDYVRLYAVYTYGGIWLDTDIEMYKSFDPFLKHQLFIGREGNEFWALGNSISSVSLLTSHCFGAEVGHPFLKLCLDFYSDRHFIRSLSEQLSEDLRYDMTILPILQAKLARIYGYKWENEFDCIQELENGIIVYPHDYFDYPKYTDMTNVVCIHRQFKAWSSTGRVKNYDDTHISRNKMKLARKIIVTFNRLLNTMNIRLKLIPY